MRLIAWDPDVETVVSRIEAKVLDLQPQFQRGEVWSKAKKQRLIDSILRDWHVPPLHVVENPTTRVQEVLDGQQRLASIRDFVRGEFEVDGSIAPADPCIERLNGLKYRELPSDVKGQFDRFSLRVYRIVDFKSTEPAELFLRLNQPTNLTSAEQRNAFFGPVRQQIKDLVDQLPSQGLDKEVIGFSNARMAYDDVLCRVALTLERRSIALKIGSSDLVELYRSERPLTSHTTESLQAALELLGAAGRRTPLRPKFNKATLYSWLIFLVRGASIEPRLGDSFVADFLSFFEFEQTNRQLGLTATDVDKWGNLPAEWLFKCYADRATSRVADVSSVVLRDVVIWLAFCGFLAKKGQDDEELPSKLRRLIGGLSAPDEDQVARTALDLGWTTLP